MKSSLIHMLTFLSTIVTSSAAITFSASSPGVSIPDGGGAGGFSGSFSDPVTSLTLDAIGHNDGLTFNEVVGSANPFSITLTSNIPLQWATQTANTNGPRAFDFRAPSTLGIGESIIITATLSSPLSSIISDAGSNAPLATILSRFDSSTPMDVDNILLQINSTGSLDLTSAAIGVTNANVSSPMVTSSSISGIADLTTFESTIALRDAFGDGIDGGDSAGFVYTITNNSTDNPDDSNPIYRITFDGNPVTVPEPSASLLALCSLGLLMRRKR